MPKLEELELWLKNNEKTQGFLADELGVTQSRVSKWVRGAEKIPKSHREKLKELGYSGPWSGDSAFISGSSHGQAHATGNLVSEPRQLKSIADYATRMMEAKPRATADTISRAIIITWEEVGDSLSTRAKARIAGHVAENASPDLSDETLRAIVRGTFLMVFDEVQAAVKKAAESQPPKESPPS